MGKQFSVIAAMLIAASPAAAGFESWTAETESDPFSKATKVVVSYMETVRSGVFMFCDSATHAVRVRVIPGYIWSAALEGATPEMQIAIDGVLVYTGYGKTGVVGDNLASAEFIVERAYADQAAAAFKEAVKQVAIKDGISDAPQLLSARGSTKAGQALEKCLSETSP